MQVKYAMWLRVELNIVSFTYLPSPFCNEGVQMLLLSSFVLAESSEQPVNVSFDLPTHFCSCKDF